MAIWGILWSSHIPSAPPCQNQCVFVHVYRISVRPRALAKFTGPLKVSPMEKTDLEDIFYPSENPASSFSFTGGKICSRFSKSSNIAGSGSQNQQIHAAQKSSETDDQDQDDDLPNEVTVESAPTVTEVVDAGYTAYHH